MYSRHVTYPERIIFGCVSTHRVPPYQSRHFRSTSTRVLFAKHRPIETSNCCVPCWLKILLAFRCSALSHEHRHVRVSVSLEVNYIYVQRPFNCPRVTRAHNNLAGVYVQRCFHLKLSERLPPPLLCGCIQWLALAPTYTIVTHNPKIYV